MFGIFNRVIRTSTRSEAWDAPSYWKDREHLSTYERQRMDAAENRMRIAREKTML